MPDDASRTDGPSDDRWETASDSSPGWDSDSVSSPGSTPTDDDRIPLDLSDDGDEGEEDDEDDPYAPEPGSTPIEAGDPDLESALFVLLGAIAMILVIARVVSLPL